jgi:putative transposase
MLRWQGFPFELLPKGQQTRHLRPFAGPCRFVYNTKHWRSTPNAEGKTFRLPRVVRPAARLEEGTPVLVRPAQAWQQALKNLERAYRAPLGREECQITCVAIVLWKTTASV